MSSSTFPRIAHLPGSHADEGDLVLSDDEAAALLRRRVQVIEKLDGLNVMLAGYGRGRVKAFLKPEWQGVDDGAVERALQVWVAQREALLSTLLARSACLYGEWLWHTVSLRYDHLDDVFVAIALRDRGGRLVPAQELDRRARPAGLRTPTVLAHRALGSLSAIRELARRSAHRRGPAEGVILDTGDDDEDRRFAKWVDPGYRHPPKGQLSGGHNRLRPAAG